MASIAIRDANNTVKYAAVAKGDGSASDPYFLQATAPIEYPTNVMVASIASTAAGTMILSANPARKHVIIQNRSDIPIDIFFGATVGAFGQGFYLGKNDTYQIDSTNLYLGEIKAIAESTTASVTYIEGI
jgi:hypothetical protein